MIKKINKFGIIALLLVYSVCIGSVYGGSLFLLENKSINLKNYGCNPLMASEIDFTQNTTEHTINWFNKQWLKNSNFDRLSDWDVNIVGDDSDLEFTQDTSMVGAKILGDTHSFSLICGPPIQEDWQHTLNPEFPAYPEWHYLAAANNWARTDSYWLSTNAYQQSFGIDQYGMWANHSWREGPKQTPSVNWVKQVSLPKNMSDYKIVSASVGGIVNASVSEYNDVEGDTYNPGSGGTIQGVVYDYAKFYIRIADLERNLMFEIAYNRTFELGKDGNPDFLKMIDTPLTAISEELLIFYLSSVLAFDYQNFEVIVGIDIFCEDDFPQDIDVFEMLRFKSFFLNFEYEKKINQGSYLEISQTGDQLTGVNTHIQNARLWYKFKTDSAWSTQSPNSEFRVLINGVQHSEIKRFSQANQSFQEADQDGIDVSKIVLKNQNITVAIQFYLSDMFYLSQNISLYIDDVMLDIVWVEVITNPPPAPPPLPPDYTNVIYGLSVAMVGMVGLATVYQLHWKYPQKIRKLRSIKKRIQSGKKIKEVSTGRTRDSVLDEIQKEELKKNNMLKKSRIVESEILSPETPVNASESISNIEKSKVIGDSEYITKVEKGTEGI